MIPINALKPVIDLIHTPHGRGFLLGFVVGSFAFLMVDHFYLFQSSVDAAVDNRTLFLQTAAKEEKEHAQEAREATQRANDDLNRVKDQLTQVEAKLEQITSKKPVESEMVWDGHDHQTFLDGLVMTFKSFEYPSSSPHIFEVEIESEVFPSRFKIYDVAPVSFIYKKKTYYITLEPFQASYILSKPRFLVNIYVNRPDGAP
jgi:hypothetical protein